MAAPFLEFIVDKTEAGGLAKRIDRLLQEKLGKGSRREVARLIADGRVRVNGKIVKKGYMATAGTTVTVAEDLPDAAALRPLPQPELALDVLYEDGELIAINKQPGLFSHPLRAGELGTVANALVARYPECAAIGDDPREAGLVHRLDVGTSGVLIAARTDDAYRALRQQFADKLVEKEYLALVEGKAGPGACELPLSGQEAFTEWTVEQGLADHTLLRCVTRTGRRHQIRIHLSQAGHPIAGDLEYGASAPHDDGPFLHAERVLLQQPRTRRPLEIAAPLPPSRAARLG
jgi:23S rRNA pseudouridine1911/1915/1917 synthase